MPPNALTRLLLFIAGVLLIGAMLAPVLWFAAQAIINAWPASSVSVFLRNVEFPSVFNRACLIAVLAGLPWLLRTLRLPWSEVIGKPFAARELGIGFLIAAVSVIIIAQVAVEAGALRFRNDAPWGRIWTPLISGLTVGCIEEILFRGVVLGVLCRALGAKAGLLWTTLVFALVHFLKPPADGTFPVDQIGWGAGFAVIPHLFRGFSHWHYFVGEFLLLLAVGWSLARARLHTHGLWLSIGLHAGWVATMKHLGQVAKVSGLLTEGKLAPWMIRNTCRAIVSPVVGVVPLFFVVCSALLAIWWVRRKALPASLTRP